MQKNLIYELEKEYEHFVLWKVYINRPVNGAMRKVFLYKTTTLKINNKRYRGKNLWKQMK